ncbi:hypothetical protein BCON_0033g00160 [Botryotinia convoluta]|uniref:Heterokaryon incompatibility domain-containing protein n=1 Tax=Botryotinia convoluta TaxID=54673 RepID=A0A4Z1IJN5_9HELO|nr:hypothetical protein BCON_0033g00160 [Botryotinia convoluta]
MVAIQARRRNDGESIPIFNDASQPLRPFTYEPLDSYSNSDSFRLITIERSLNENDTLSCKLVSTEFGEKPRFRALSYMWGEDTANKTIMLNGAEFHVRQNLWDALHCFRKSGMQSQFWVDAICINQNDISERNKQLMIMKRIYFRAESVVVWLGKKYERYKQVARARTDRVIFENIHTEGPQASDITSETTVRSEETLGSLNTESKDSDILIADNEEREMVKELCTDGYWNRLWIIQEIGRVRQIEVRFGEIDMSWKAFIEVVILHENSHEGPLRLNSLLREKYSSIHTFRKLLSDHREALCKEPRDKIYGLVGLAADTIGFTWTTTDLWSKYGRIQWSL